jgi:hypothetical protein
MRLSGLSARRARSSSASNTSWKPRVEQAGERIAVRGVAEAGDQVRERVTHDGDEVARHEERRHGRDPAVERVLARRLLHPRQRVSAGHERQVDESRGAAEEVEDEHRDPDVRQRAVRALRAPAVGRRGGQRRAEQRHCVEAPAREAVAGQEQERAQEGGGRGRAEQDAVVELGGSGNQHGDQARERNRPAEQHSGTSHRRSCGEAPDTVACRVPPAQPLAEGPIQCSSPGLCTSPRVPCGHHMSVGAFAPEC